MAIKIVQMGVTKILLMSGNQNPFYYIVDYTYLLRIRIILKLYIEMSFTRFILRCIHIAILEDQVTTLERHVKYLQGKQQCYPRSLCINVTALLSRTIWHELSRYFRLTTNKVTKWSDICLTGSGVTFAANRRVHTIRPAPVHGPAFL